MLHQVKNQPTADQCSLLKEVVAKVEKNAIQDALKLTHYNKAKAAMLLGIHRTLLYKKMQKYQISTSAS